MIERRFSFAGIPLLTIASSEGLRPAVLFYHGLQADKETHRKELEQLASRGFLAVGVDAVGHGERRMSNISEFLNRDELRTQVSKLLRPTLAEIPLLVDHLLSCGCYPIALGGISFGGMIAFGAAKIEPRLRAIVAILGDPTISAAQPADFTEIALLAWNAGRDQHVTPSPARELLAALCRRNKSGRYAYREYPDSDHFLRPEDWDDGWSTTLAWFERHLQPQR